MAKQYSFAELSRQADRIQEALASVATNTGTVATPERPPVANPRPAPVGAPPPPLRPQAPPSGPANGKFAPPPNMSGKFELDVHDGRIWAHTPFSYKDHLKAVGGARWDPDAKRWHFPADTFTAQRIARAIPDHVAARTPAFLVLLETGAKEEADRLIIMRADDEALAPIPITKLAAWGHQRRAYWSAQGHDGYLLAMDMGTGKSKVTIDEIQNCDDRLIFIGCPKSVVGVWPREFAKHALNPQEFRIVALRSGSTERNLAQAKQGYALAQAEGRRLVIVVNYEAAWREAFAKWALSIHWDRVIADESHRLKSAQGKASKFFEALGKRAKKRRALTGTPMAHTPLDVFGQFRFTNPEVFGLSYTAFKKRYGAWGGYGGYQLVGILNENELNEKFYRHAYRVGKEVLDLPEVLPEIRRDVLLGLRARKLYRDMATEFVAWVKGEGDFDHAVTASNALGKLLRLQQITSGYLPDATGEDTIEIVDTAKAKALEDILEDLAPDEPVVVFCRFRADLDAIKGVTEGLKRRYGELSGRSRDGLTADAEMSPNVDVIGVQLQSGGVGIDLTRARYCIYFSLGFSLTDYEQSRARVHRPGQTRPVQYIHLRAPGTVDEHVIQALTDRKDAVNAILDLVTATADALGDAEGDDPE